MVDVFSTARRSAIMSHIKGKDTAPEKYVRKLLHALGMRFRLHRKDLPGKPDIVLPRRRKIIFVHGCFWHGHDGCRRAALPNSNADFWAAKVRRNKVRDQETQLALRRLRWKCLVIWQCEMKDEARLIALLQTFVNGQ
jgi:DNA mismatch endonuclease (patch repair protein)